MKKRKYTEKQKEALRRSSLKWYYKNRERALEAQAKYRNRKAMEEDESDEVKVRKPLPLFGI